MKCLNILFAGLLLGISVVGQSMAAVTVVGDVRTPGSIEINHDTRMLDVITAAQPNVESYWLAAMWLHKPLVEEQLRLKLGVLFDLKMLERGAMLYEKPARAALAAELFEQVSRLPVTGRRLAVLDPVAIEVGFARNYHLDEGDSLIYPQRPDTVEVLGAVAAPCLLQYHAMQEARQYLESCTPLADAEADYLWIIQPDGQIRRIGIAAWNRESGSALAPGSKILVPIRSDDIDPPTPELNQQLAEFLATQPVAEVEP